MQLAAFAARHGHPDVPEDFDGDAVNAVSSGAAAAAAARAAAADAAAAGQEQQAEQPVAESGKSFLSSSPASAGLGAWAARQRAAWQAGALDAERAAALAGLGFDFGDGELSFFEFFFVPSV